MKKRYICLLIIIICFSSLYSAAVENVKTKSIRIQAGVSNTLYVAVQPIAAQSQAYIMGMPFSIDDALVKYEYKEKGRHIASWSILTNTNFDITVVANDLVHETEKDEKISYYLCFDYSLSYFPISAKDPITKEGAFVIKSEGNDDTDNPSSYVDSKNSDFYMIKGSGEKFNLISDADSGTQYIGALDGAIYFKMSEASDKINSSTESYPGGNYSGLVKITVEAQQ